MLLSKYHDDDTPQDFFTKFASYELLAEGQRCVYALLEYNLHVSMEEIARTKDMLIMESVNAMQIMPSINMTTLFTENNEKDQIRRIKKQRFLLDLYCHDTITGL